VELREVRHTVRIEFGSPEVDAPWPDEVPEHLAAEPDPTPEAEASAANPKPGRRSRFTTLSITELLALPPPDWLIFGILTTGSYAGIYGPPGSLKSFTVLGMGLSVAYGQPWAGRAVKQMGVLYVAGEGARGLGKRIRAWQQHFGMQGVEAPFRVLSDGVNLTDPKDLADLIAATVEAAAAEGQAIGLVIIDTVARAMVGADENSAQDMGRFNEACAELIRQVDGAPNVFAVHHSGKDEERGSRGSSSFPGAVDTMLKVKREEGRITLRVEKQKDDEDGFDVRLKAVGVRAPGAGPDDKPYSLVVLDASDDAAPKGGRKKEALPAGAQLCLSALVGVVGQIGTYRQGLANVPSTVKSVTELEWRHAFYARSAANTQEAKSTAFRRAHEQLAAKGVVVMVDSFAWIVEAGRD
jgi:hypothetical protein